LKNPKRYQANNSLASANLRKIIVKLLIFQSMALIMDPTMDLKMKSNKKKGFRKQRSVIIMKRLHLKNQKRRGDGEMSFSRESSVNVVDFSKPN
jgi:hypothetical protein